jgi:hypothetical protein
MEERGTRCCRPRPHPESVVRRWRGAVHRQQGFIPRQRSAEGDAAAPSRSCGRCPQMTRRRPEMERHRPWTRGSVPRRRGAGRRRCRSVPIRRPLSADNELPSGDGTAPSVDTRPSQDGDAPEGDADAPSRSSERRPQAASRRPEMERHVCGHEAPSRDGRRRKEILGRRPSRPGKLCLLVAFAGPTPCGEKPGCPHLYPPRLLRVAFLDLRTEYDRPGHQQASAITTEVGKCRLPLRA